MGKDVRARRWAFTLFNAKLTRDEVLSFVMCCSGVDYCIIGVEKCPSTGKVHYQGYLEFTNPTGMKIVKKILPTAHVETCKGDQASNMKYCKKEGDWAEKGTPKTQGSREDLLDIRRLALSDGMSAVVNVGNMQQIRVAEIYLKYWEAPRTSAPEVYWYWGEPGSGKTRAAECASHASGERTWWSGKNSRWWEGYDGHENIIIDDYRRDRWCSFSELLRITDRYPYRIEVKGGSRQLVAKRIYITCPYSPEECFQDEPENIKQILRRIKETIRVNLPDTDVGVILEPKGSPPHQVSALGSKCLLLDS